MYMLSSVSDEKRDPQNSEGILLPSTWFYTARHKILSNTPGKRAIIQVTFLCLASYILAERIYIYLYANCELSIEGKIEGLSA
jgi:hypothetical protein